GEMGELATRSLFEIWEDTGVVQPTSLTICYRCHFFLLEFLHAEFYHNNLSSGLKENISASLLARYPFPRKERPTVFINCPGIERTDSTGSKFNFEEAECAIQLVKQLVASSAAIPAQITILTFYYGQSVIIQESLLLEPGLESLLVSSVDGIQGREQNIIILSAVRAATSSASDGTLHKHPTPTLGFITDRRRLNVALSRCRTGLFIIGDQSHLSSTSPLWMRLVDYYSKNGMTASTVAISA
ncbi:MAG: hypothetical protein GY816_17645, partial [Cytophagales bacterium]|nr:hypothetical protein [Cytophagales bacterium]